MKTILSIVAFFAGVLFSYAQHIEKKIFFVSTNAGHINWSRGTAGTTLKDGGFCIGGLTEFEFPDGSQTPEIKEQNFVFKIDSLYNVVWIDASQIMDTEDKNYKVHSVFQTSDSGIIADKIVRVGGVVDPSELFKFENDGALIWNKPLSDSNYYSGLKITSGEMVNDTLLYSALHVSPLTFNSFHPILLILNSNGDTISIKDSVDLRCQENSVIQIVKDHTNQLYCILERDSTIIHKINSDGSIISTTAIGALMYNEKIIPISPERFVKADYNLKYFNFYDYNSTLLDSVNFGIYIAAAYKGWSSTLLADFLYFGSTPSYLGRSLIQMDSTGTIMWGFTHDENISQVIQTSENEFVLLGTAYDTTILKMGVLFEKITKPNFNRTLSIPDSVLCNNDSILISAPSGYTYNWNNGDTSQEIYVSSSGNYFALIIDSEGFFTYSDTATITNSNTIGPELGADTILCLIDSILLDAGNGFATYQWSTGSSAQFINISDSLETITQYFVTVADSNGCVFTDSIQIQFATCTNINEIVNDEIEIYPNPTTGILFINFKSSLSGSITIYDQSGKEIVSKEINKNQNTVDLYTLPSGIYNCIYIDAFSKKRQLIKFVKK